MHQKGNASVKGALKVTEVGDTRHYQKDKLQAKQGFRDGVDAQWE
jgi:hypothetical protein